MLGDLWEGASRKCTPQFQQFLVCLVLSLDVFLVACLEVHRAHLWGTQCVGIIFDGWVMTYALSRVFAYCAALGRLDCFGRLERHHHIGIMTLDMYDFGNFDSHHCSREWAEFGVWKT